LQFLSQSFAFLQRDCWFFGIFPSIIKKLDNLARSTTHPIRLRIYNLTSNIWIHMHRGEHTHIYYIKPVDRWWGNDNYERILKAKEKRVNNANTHVTHMNRLDTEIFFRSLFLILYIMRINGYFWNTVL
jgi:hypothetical protein